MKNVVLCIILYSLFSCKSVPKISTSNEITLLPKKLELRERFSSCDESITYMNSIIIPNQKSTFIKSNLETQHLGEISINILNDKNQSKIKDLYLFYIDLDCLKELPKDKLFKMLLSEKHYTTLTNLLNSEKGKTERFFFEGEFVGLNCFTLVINKDNIESINWCKTKNSHGN
ncbi:MAG TPA: hypothetical protein PKA44_05075 [Saprospiraceae bacterium]|jgi:hypothetical protein|nr:hypothetical protein [Saprospiraceae bacterium]